MEWYWWFLIVGNILLILTIISYFNDWGLEWISGIYSIIFFSFFLVGLGDSIGEKNAYKNILKGKPNPYEMVIQYELKDSLYVPVDTLFILKEEK